MLEFWLTLCVCLVLCVYIICVWVQKWKSEETLWPWSPSILSGIELKSWVASTFLCLRSHLASFSSSPPPPLLFFPFSFSLLPSSFIQRWSYMVLNPFHTVSICSVALPKTFKVFITFISAHQALEQSLVISVTFLQCFTATETRSVALGCSAGVKCLPGMQEGLVPSQQWANLSAIIIPALRKWRQENQKFKVIFSYVGILR